MIYIVFIATHLIFDYVIGWVIRWIRGTTQRNKFLHYFIYTVGFIPVFLFFGISFWWLLLIFSSHLLIDRTVFPGRILISFKKCLFKKFNIQIKKESHIDNFLYWILVTIEQLLHIVILFIIINRYIIINLIVLYLF